MDSTRAAISGRTPTAGRWLLGAQLSLASMVRAGVDAALLAWATFALTPPLLVYPGKRCEILLEDAQVLRDCWHRTIATSHESRAPRIGTRSRSQIQ